MAGVEAAAAVEVAMVVEAAAALEEGQSRRKVDLRTHFFGIRQWREMLSTQASRLGSPT